MHTYKHYTPVSTHTHTPMYSYICIRPVLKISIRQNIVSHSFGIRVSIRILQNRYGLNILTVVVNTLWVMLTVAQFKVEDKLHNEAYVLNLNLGLPSLRI